MNIHLHFSKKCVKGISSDTIFDNFLKNKIILPHSCLKGRCSECKIKVLEGKFEMPENQEGLTDEEIRNGYCLSCISKPLTDLKLDNFQYLEGFLPEVKIIPAKISSLEFLGLDVVKITLRTPPNKRLNFIPGQYLDLFLHNLKRSYSIASVPGDSSIELIIKKYHNGIFSNYFFNEAMINDLLRIEGPKGTYTLPTDTPKKLIFVSTGTGIAPHLSILKSAIVEGKLKKSQIIVIHGQRTVNEHIYDLEKALPGVRILRTTSRETAKGFINGYVQDAVKKLTLDISETMIFACGNPQMIKDLKIMMVARGLDKKKFKSDMFVPSN